MGMQLALPNAEPTLKGGIRLPPVVPPFNTRAYRLFSVIWIAVFLLAFVGPLAGFYYRYTSPENNSQLLLGSRAGFAVSPRDATKVRFTVGPEAGAAGIRAGDHIIAVFGIPLPKTMPFNEEALAEHADDPAYIAMGNVLFGTDTSEVPLTVRDSTGDVREVTVATGERSQISSIGWLVLSASSSLAGTSSSITPSARSTRWPLAVSRVNRISG
jgi:membrane-associated protease RseP (regulator of RpoE activity)